SGGASSATGRKNRRHEMARLPLFSLVLAITLLAACSQPEAQLAKLNVQAVSPADGATDVAVNTVVSVEFDGKVNGESAIGALVVMADGAAVSGTLRSEEHTSELQSRENLVCRLLLEKKNK